MYIHLIVYTHISLLTLLRGLEAVIASGILGEVGIPKLRQGK